MRFISNLLKTVFFFSFLTSITQIGGVVYLLYKPLVWKIKKKNSKNRRFLARLGIFLGLYLLVCFFIVPPIAKKAGRVPLPLFSSSEVPLKSRSVFYNLTCRNYVIPQLKGFLLKAATDFNNKYPGVTISYLDAGFPFFKNFPLLPHLSHDDGRKVDLAFIYKNLKNGERSTRLPSFLGYGVSEGPEKGETDMPGQCAQKGYWQYNLLDKIVPKRKEPRFEFDKAATKDLLLILAKEKSCGKIFIEPHLKKRLGLNHYDKIRFHGCQAVRHDDHIHLEL